MANIVSGDVYEVRIVTALGNQIAVNILHYLATTQNGTGGTDQVFANFADIAFAPVYKPLTSAAATYRGVGVKRVVPFPPGGEVVSVAQAGACTAAGDVLPKQVAGLIAKLSATAGRHGRGRLYTPFPTESQNDALGLPTAAYITLMTNLATILTGTFTVAVGINTTLMVPCLFNRTALTTINITSHIARPRWGTQRRRGDFGRTNLPPF